MLLGGVLQSPLVGGGAAAAQAIGGPVTTSPRGTFPHLQRPDGSRAPAWANTPASDLLRLAARVRANRLDIF